ncbi:hypothetical protein A2W32_04555 [candidate division WWE3 bacterium RBG_16_37_10]|uniref:Uncharacterized protein n=1 Tax=candidate division WWE3 bacterium RBG_16_37_10 TaxID=1802610 RepID=A0A1F4V2Z0_UNCKA|nr:MAG: hypothetical protein A2W32_04555 [candidate division WWE3 bacterium RBG_16_37_10]
MPIKEKRKKIAILTAMGGYGHLSYAFAYDYWLSLWGYQTEIFNVGLTGNQEIYKLLLKKPFAYKSFFMLSNMMDISNILVKRISGQLEKKLENLLPKYNEFDAVISTHPLIHPNKGKKNFVVLLDPFLHSTYFANPQPDYYLSIWKESDRFIEKYKIDKQKVLHIGPLLRPAFYKYSSKLQSGEDKMLFKKDLHVEKYKKVCLLMAGGLWINRAWNYMEILSKKSEDSNVLFVFLCGKNDEFRKEATSEYGKNELFKFLSWQDEESVAKWMGASDLAVVFSIAQMGIEAGIMGVPILIFNYIHGQEGAYVDLLEKHGVAKHIEGNSSEKVDYLISELNHLSKYDDSLYKWQKFLKSTPGRMHGVINHYLN